MDSLPIEHGDLQLANSQIVRLLEGEATPSISIQSHSIPSNLIGSHQISKKHIIFSALQITKDSLLAKYRPDLLHLPTTNGDHTTGDGIKMGEAIGARSIDLEWVQVHPTGLGLETPVA